VTPIQSAEDHNQPIEGTLRLRIIGQLVPATPIWPAPPQLQQTMSNLGLSVASRTAAFISASVPCAM
jgi:hypothetical protein